MNEPTFIRLDQINTGGGTQARVTLDDVYVTELVESERVNWPPIEVYDDGEVLWLVDGFHRVQAAKELGLQMIRANVTKGDRRAAILASVSANMAHGLRRTNEDKRKAVLTLLRDAEWGKWSDRMIAASAGVTHPFVASVRESLVTVTTPPPVVKKKVEQEAVDEDEVEVVPLPSPKPKPPVDDVGTELDDPLLVEVFADTQAEDLCRTLGMLLKDVKQLASCPSGARVNVDAIEAAIRDVQARLRNTAPHAKCPYPHVGNNPCRMCRGTAWLTKAEYQAVPEEMKS
jgi:hypothetical protein